MFGKAPNQQSDGKMNCSYHDRAFLRFADPAGFERLREALTRAEFHERSVAAALRVESRAAVTGQDTAVLLRRIGHATPLDAFVRLFVIRVPVDEELLRHALAPAGLEALLGAGLVRRDPAGIAAVLQVLPFDGLWLAYDLPPWAASQAGAGADYVMGIGSSSLTLANATVRRFCAHTLDLGAGCGFQAFLASRHSERVLAVDRNPRAVAIAEFNARLNALGNVECREGDLFAPVREEQFDLIVSNPPFVISPESRYIYRDSGMKGDEVTQQIIRHAPARLNDGGFCQILCNWAHSAGQSWKDRLASWFRDTGCDAWVMCTDTLPSDAYAAKWIRHTERDDPEAFAERFDRWMTYYDEQGIEAVCGGLITLRRRDGGKHWFRADEGPEKMLGPAGASIAEVFALEDFLEATRQDEHLLDRKLCASPDCRLVQRFEPVPEGWQLSESELCLARGLGYSGNADLYTMRLVGQCDGSRPSGKSSTRWQPRRETTDRQLRPTASGSYAG